jgi:hypothetical protein
VVTWKGTVIKYITSNAVTQMENQLFFFMEALAVEAALQ